MPSPCSLSPHHISSPSLSLCPNPFPSSVPTLYQYRTLFSPLQPHPIHTNQPPVPSPSPTSFSHFLTFFERIFCCYHHSPPLYILSKGFPHFHLPWIPPAIPLLPAHPPSSYFRFFCPFLDAFFKAIFTRHTACMYIHSIIKCPALINVRNILKKSKLTLLIDKA